MCGGVHYGEVEGLVSVERWSCSRGASCVMEYTMGRLRDWSLQRGGLVAEHSSRLTESQAQCDFPHHLCNMFTHPILTISAYQAYYS